MIVYGLLSVYKFYFLNQYSFLIEDYYYIKNGAIVSMFSLGVIGFCFDKYSILRVTIGYLLILAVHSIVFFVIGDQYRGLAYFLFLFGISPLYAVIIMICQYAYCINYKEAFSLANVGLLLSYYFVFIVEISNSFSNTGGFVLTFSLALISVVLVNFIRKTNIQLFEAF